MKPPDVERFVRAAREYCLFVETAAKLTPEERRETARERFASLYAPNVGCALLDGDVLETYREIKEGLLHWDAGRQGCAVFDWHSGFHAHWGSHVAHALWALHAHWAET